MTNNMTQARFMIATAFNSIKQQFAAMGYPNTNDDGEITIWDDDKPIVKALPHSNGKSYIVAYDGEYMTKK